MPIGSERWGGIRPDPYKINPVDADNDGIVQEGTLYERPAGTRLISALTGLELEPDTTINGILELGTTRLVDREGREVPYRQSWRTGTPSAGEQNGTIGGKLPTIGATLGTLDGPPDMPKPKPVLLRSTDVDKNGKPLRVFVSDDRRFHGVLPTDWAGFDNPARIQAERHWASNANGLILPVNETPISPTDPRLPEKLFIHSLNPNAHRDLGVVRADSDSKKVTAYTTRADALEAQEALVKEADELAKQTRIDEFFKREDLTLEAWLDSGMTLEDALDQDRQWRINDYIAKNGYTLDAWLEAGDLFGGHYVGDTAVEAPAIVNYPRGWGSLVESEFRRRNPGLAAWLDREDEIDDADQGVLFDLGGIPVESPLEQLREEYSSFSSWLNATFDPIRREPLTDEQLDAVNASLQNAFGQAVDPDFIPHTLRDPKTGRFIVEPKQREIPFGDVVEVPVKNIATGAAVTHTPHTTRDPKTGRFVKASQVHVYGDVRIDTEAAATPVRRKADIPTPESLKPIKERFDAEGAELYLVGGAVRDTLMGREIKDYDLATNATPDEVQAMLADVEGARLDLTGKDFAVVRVTMPDGEEYEIATFRRDVGEGRRPGEVELTTIDEDVRRRDLTMNALFYDLSTNEIVDYVGGIDDIENGVVRAVGDPGERFREDPLRILRAFRFSGRTGWGMDSATVDAIRANSKLRGVSGERVHDEFVRGIDSAVSPSGYIQQIDLVDNGTGAVWGQIFPGLNVSPERLPDDRSYGNRAVLLASLLADNDIDDVKAVLKDRKFTNDEIADVELIMQARRINDGNVATLKNKFGKNRRVSADDMRAFHRIQPDTEDDIEPFLEFADAPPALTANDLVARGIKPGPQFGEMLREAEEQRYREIRDGFSVDNPGHDEGEAPPLPDAPDKLFVGSSDEKNVRQSPDEVRAHMESAGFRMGNYDDGKIIGALRGDVDDPYDDRVFFTVEEGPDGGSTIRRLSIRDVESSELVQRVVRARTDQWREGVASRGRAWHAVRAYDNNFGRALQGLGDDEPNPAQPVAETIDSIRNEGLVPSRISRVDSNSSIGDAIFLSESRDEISGFASPHIDADGDEQPTAFLEIDLRRALDDGVIDAEDLSPEPFLFEGQVVRELSERLGGSVFPSDAYYDVPGVTEQSIVLRKPIPNDYISINGRNIRDVGTRDLKPNDSGSPAAAPETPSADLPESVVPEGRNWERPSTPSPDGFDRLLFADTQSGHKAHVYSSFDEEVDEVLDRIYDTAVERGWGMKIANDFFWDEVHGPDADRRNRGQRGKGVTVYFPNSKNWEEDARELHRLMEGYEPAGDGDIPEDVMIGNGVGMRYEFARDPGEDLDMTDRAGKDRYFQMYRPAGFGHTPESLAVHNRYRELFPEVESDDPIDPIDEIMGTLFGDRGRRGPTPGIPSNADRDTVSFKDADQRIDALTVNAPELASSPGETRRRLAPKEGEEQRGYAFVSPEVLEIHQEETLGFIAKMETLEASRDLTDDEQDMLAKARAHSAKIASDIDSGGGYYQLEIKTFDNDGEIETPESITKALNSARFKQALDSVLAEVAPEFRSSRIAISPVDSAGETLPAGYGFYYPGEDRIYLNPQFFEHIFQDLGVPFEDYAAWANSRGTWKPRQDRLDWVDSLDMVGLKSYLRNRANPGAMDALPEGFNLDRATLDDKPILVKAIKEYEAVQRHRDLWNPNIRNEERAEMVQRYRADLRALVLHENFHGVHFRKDGTFKSPEFIEARDKVIAALKASKLFDDLIDDEDDFYDDDNYFRYLMTWLGQGGPSGRKDKKDLLKDLNRKSADKESIGAELFAEAMTHAMMGRKFPGSDILLDYITGQQSDGIRERLSDLSSRPSRPAPGRGVLDSPTLGVPDDPGPDRVTGWDRDRLTASVHRFISEDPFLPASDLIDGVHLGPEQKSLSTVVSDTSVEDLTSLRDNLKALFETGSISSQSQSSEVSWQFIGTLDEIIELRGRDTSNLNPEEMEAHREELANFERALSEDVVGAVQAHWGSARSEIFHWDFLSDRVKTVLGEEYGIEVSHSEREPNAGWEDIWEVQDALEPFVDAWVRGQYSSTQKLLADKGITELTVYRGLYLPNRADEDLDGATSRGPAWSSRGMESWSTDLEIALGFAGNRYGTADTQIEELADEELGEPTHILMHDVVPAAYILGMGDQNNRRNPSASIGEGEEAEIVVLGSRRPIDQLSNDFLKDFERPREENDNAVNFVLNEADLIEYLSSNREYRGSDRVPEGSDATTPPDVDVVDPLDELGGPSLEELLEIESNPVDDFLDIPEVSDFIEENIDDVEDVKQIARALAVEQRRAADRDQRIAKVNAYLDERYPGATRRPWTDWLDAGEELGTMSPEERQELAEEMWSIGEAFDVGEYIVKDRVGKERKVRVIIEPAPGEYDSGYDEYVDGRGTVTMTWSGSFKRTYFDAETDEYLGEQIDGGYSRQLDVDPETGEITIKHNVMVNSGKISFQAEDDDRYYGSDSGPTGGGLAKHLNYNAYAYYEALSPNTKVKVSTMAEGPWIWPRQGLDSLINPNSFRYGGEESVEEFLGLSDAPIYSEGNVRSDAPNFYRILSQILVAPTSEHRQRLRELEAAYNSEGFTTRDAQLAIENPIDGVYVNPQGRVLISRSMMISPEQLRRELEQAWEESVETGKRAPTTTAVIETLDASGIMLDGVTASAYFDRLENEGQRTDAANRILTSLNRQFSDSIGLGTGAAQISDLVDTDIR